MKKRSVLNLIVLFFLLLTLQTVEVDASQVNSKDNYIEFKENTSSKPPLDPLDPNNPTPPMPIDPLDPMNKGTGNVGALTIDYVPSIKFGKQQLANGDKHYFAQNQDPFVQVTDLRGAGTGWNLTAQVSKFMNSDGTKELKGAVLSFKEGAIKTRSGNVSSAPEGYDLVFDSQDTYTLMQAGEGSGKGTWLDVFSGEAKNNENIQLLVLEGSAETNVRYTAIINWALSDVPKPVNNE
ncbi:WxL domain-containing protein [Enterococcus rotai]|uniref:WxL domain-containing protein n=1 Tax=Enterococcus rotai TaxID=118060 RepID=UPI0035C76E3C